MDIIELINTVKKESKLMNRKKEELERLKSLCEVTGISFEERISSTPNTKRTEQAYLNYIEYKEELEKFIGEAIENRKKLVGIIDTLDDKKEIQLMYMYCLNDRSMNYIAKKMNYTRQRVYQMYNKIIDKLSTKI